MATINLGAIKFNWKGAYNNSTAYAVDDVVSSGGSSYICILASQGNAVSNGTYWNLMAEAGTDGTNVATTLTTQGDLLYRDGSGIQRLAAGTSGQALITGGSGANPSWGSAGGVVQVKSALLSTNVGVSVSVNSYTAIPTNTWSLNITPTSASNKIMLFVQANTAFLTTQDNRTRLAIFRDSTQLQNTETIENRKNAFMGSYIASESRELANGSFMMLDSPNTTSQVNYNFKMTTDGSGTAYINRSKADQNDGGGFRTTSSITAFEIDSGVL